MIALARVPAPPAAGCGTAELSSLPEPTALEIRGVPAALVRVPDASHGIASRPSNLIAKTAYVLGCSEKWRWRRLAGGSVGGAVVADGICPLHYWYG